MTPVAITMMRDSAGNALAAPLGLIVTATGIAGVPTSSPESLIGLPMANGTTPLMAAAGMGHGNNPTRGRLNTEDDALAAIPILLAGGAEVNAQAVNGQTAVHAAVEKSWGRVIRLLAESGADLELADRGGRTPMDHAMGVGGRGLGGRGGRGGPAPANREMVRLLSELIR